MRMILRRRRPMDDILAFTVAPPRLLRIIRTIRPLLADRILLICIREAILPRFRLDLLVCHEWHFEGCFDVGDILEVALGKDEIDFLEGALLGFGVEEVDDRDEAGVYDGEEEVGSPGDAGDHDGGYHDYEEVEEPVGLVSGVVI